MTRAWVALVGLLATTAFAQTPPPVLPPAPGSPPAPAPNAWEPRGGFELQALDKVSARTIVVSGRVGQTVHYASLSITVRACLVRPPDQPLDAAVYLDIEDAHPAMPRFDGWMLLSEPAVSMLEHPVYDITLKACVP